MPTATRYILAARRFLTRAMKRTKQTFKRIATLVFTRTAWVFLKNTQISHVTELEKIESLEQLRVLHHGYKIGVTITQNAPASGVDTQEDLDYVRSVFKD